MARHKSIPTRKVLTGRGNTARNARPTASSESSRSNFPRPITRNLKVDVSERAGNVDTGFLSAPAQASPSTQNPSGSLVNALVTVSATGAGNGPLMQNTLALD
ncbi:hypothetical protein RUND412_004357 [Rhizina undulata]